MISAAGISEDLCTPDAVSPAQFHDMWSGTSDRTAEFKLALAVLEQTIEDLRKYHGATATEPRRLYVQARRWVASNDRRWPYSFVNVCDLLDLSFARVRTKLLGEPTEAPVDIVRTADSEIRNEAGLEQGFQLVASG